jgi:hypothetical protein
MRFFDTVAGMLVTFTTEVKFLARTAGGSLQYETGNMVDMTVVHDSYSALRSALVRQGKVVMRILHANTLVRDDDSRLGISLHPAKRMLVEYADSDVSPILYNGFQG